MSEIVAFAGQVTVQGRKLRGSIPFAGQRTLRDNEWVEVDPAALIKADAANVTAAFNHDPSKVLARTINGTLTVFRTEKGLDYETGDLPNTTDANDTLELARAGYFAGSSFTVEVGKTKFDTAEDGRRVRRLVQIKRLIDVAPVFDPAFKSSVAAFSKENQVDPQDPQPDPQPEPPEPKQKWAAFAADLTTEQIQAQMEAVFSSAKGDLSGEMLDRYEGFAQELTERKRKSTADRQRIERMEFEHNVRMGRVPKAPETELFASDDYAAAFATYLRTGDKNVMAQFAQSVAGDGTQGGYTVPDGFLNRVVVRMKAFGGVQKVADSITTADGQPLRWPSVDDTANSAVITAEGVAAGSGGADLVFGDVTLGAYTFDATGASNLPLLVSKELLQDSAIDMEAFIGDRLAERLGRKMASEFANGTGSGEPMGLFAKSPDVMTATAAYAAFVEHLFQVDQAYRDDGNLAWIMSDTTLAKLYNSVDKNARPLFSTQAGSGGSGAPSLITGPLGYPVVLDQAAGTAVAFGDFRRGFIIRYVRGVQIDVDPYTAIKTRQVAYHAWARADSNVQDGNAYSVSDYTGVSANAAS